MGWRFRKSFEKKPGKIRSIRDVGNDRRGMTLVELVVVLVILMILSSVIVPSMTGYIDRAKKQKYVMEAQAVRQSIELYLLEQYASDDMDVMDFFEGISAWELNDSNCPVSDYLETVCSEGAYIQNLTLKEGGVSICEMVYVVDGYRVELDSDGYSVTRMESAR